MKKGTFILIVIASLRIFTSCIFGCECEPPEIVYFSINEGIVDIFENTNENDYNNIPEEIIPEAIAFNIELTDSNLVKNGYYAKSKDISSLIGFQSAYATDCDCVWFTYQLKSKITDIHLITLLDYSDEYKAGDDIIPNCFAHENYKLSRSLYIDVCDLMNTINTMNSSDYPEINFKLFLKDPPKADTIQFQLVIELDNGGSFMQKTDRVALTKSNK